MPRYEEINHTHRASTRVTCHFLRQSYHQISDLYYLHCPTLCYSCAKSWRWSGNELYETKVLQIELSAHKVYRFITIIIDVVKMIVVSLTVLLLIKNEKINQSGVCLPSLKRHLRPSLYYRFMEYVGN